MLHVWSMSTPFKGMHTHKHAFMHAHHACSPSFNLPMEQGGIRFLFKVRQHLSGPTSRNSRFFGNIKYDICNIYFKLKSLNSQIKIQFNDIKHYVATKQKNLC